MSLVSFLRETCRRCIDQGRDGQKRLTPELMLTALMLDRAGFTVSAIAPGQVVVLHLDNDLHSAFEKLLQLIAPGRCVIGPEEASSAEDAIVVTRWWARFDVDAALCAIVKNGHAFVILRPLDDPGVIPPLTSRVANRAYQAPACTGAIIEDLIFQMMNDRVTIPPGEHHVAHVLLAVRPTTVSAKEAARVLKSLDDFVTGKDDGKVDNAGVAQTISDLASSEEPPKDEKTSPKEPEKPAEPPVVRLRDLSGYGPAKDWGMQLAADLELYREGKLRWADVDKGLLLSGPPGCGKTYFAKALAAECNAPLIESSYGDWENATGSGNLVVKAIKKVFADARKQAPCILFIDEIDAIGSRGRRLHNSGWFDVIINGVLAELDGAKPRDGVVVVAATNYPWTVDPALLRPGRLDRHIAIPRPTIADIRGFLAHHLGEIDGLDQAARACRGRSPAEIAQIAREARRAARRQDRQPRGSDVQAVVRADFKRSEQFDRVACVHEAGHALVSVALGVGVAHLDVDHCETVNVAAELFTLKDIESQIAIGMVGCIAEQELLGEMTMGNMADVENVTRAALVAIKCGLDGAPIFLDNIKDNAPLSLLQPDVRERVDKMIAAGLDRAREIVKERRDDLRRLAEAARRERYLEGDEITKIVAGRPSGEPSTAAREVKETETDAARGGRSPAKAELRSVSAFSARRRSASRRSSCMKTECGRSRCRRAFPVSRSTTIAGRRSLSSLTGRPLWEPHAGSSTVPGKRAPRYAEPAR